MGEQDIAWMIAGRAGFDGPRSHRHQNWRHGMNEQGIAWMIAGGRRSETPEDQRPLLHRVAIAERRPSRRDTLLRMRQRIAAAMGGRTVERRDLTGLGTDCCPA